MKKRNQGSDLFEPAQHGQFVPMIASTTKSRQRISGNVAGTNPAVGHRYQRPPQTLAASQYRPNPETSSSVAGNSVR
ncbi:hypothetical protein [Arthrobacter sp. 18067]|uniref:hypothetical protein n=1 Tax=Arthrobacter sp. 18067 TaxID=2681413 RepID=UPI001359A540|nr:hypothetical protein [Arthrobacter sp. 18067]